MVVSLTRRPSRRRRALLAAVPVIAGLTVAALAGCTSGGAGTATGTTDDDAKGVNIVIIGGASDDAFFSSIKRGVDDAKKVVESHGGKVTYLALKDYNNIGPDAAQLVKNALGQKPSLIAVPDWVPEAENPAIKSVVDAGIPVILYNAGGYEEAEKVGALTYIGTDEYLAGVAGGEALGKAGVKKNVCVNTVPGAQNLEDRCRGVADGLKKSGGESTQLSLAGSSYGNQTAVSQAIKAALQKDSDVDGLATVGGSDAAAALDALKQSGVGDKVKYVHFNVDSKILDAVKSGVAYATIDQQPYLQGFYAVSAGFQYVTYGLDTPTKPILTGPLVVDKDNVDKAVSGAKAGVR
ncbi:sugar ABC transporter substrate-binding protein [Schumannella luteola]|uniref:Simple sugar transport system substrate-binding protein n=1 Tax=Schumannella luteola TaxID=472059 RepID=A0A852YL92_9MICO|nr:substrate-binding domain-containing protein [Schumannella luteola]NYG98509.1 simple sugar transport system substrate-binding protein [Schumannella luteola]TPX01267.1 substrate-binding domain-containing protein [Schumannella luteola]